jgi:hypothetical protein
VPTTFATPNWRDTGAVAAEKMLLPMVALRASKASMAPMPSFFFVGQFCACSGSSAPSNSTTYSSRSGSGGGYGLPAPICGSALSVRRRVSVLDSRESTREAPTVPACWLRCVSMRRMASGWRSVGWRVSALPAEAWLVKVPARSRAGVERAVRISSRRALRADEELAELDVEADEVLCRERGDAISSASCGRACSSRSRCCGSHCWYLAGSASASLRRTA